MSERRCLSPGYRMLTCDLCPAVSRLSMSRANLDPHTQLSVYRGQSRRVTCDQVLPSPTLPIKRNASEGSERLVIRCSLPSSHPGSFSSAPIITNTLHVRSTVTFPMAQIAFQGVSRTLLAFTPQTFLCSLLSTEDDRSHDNSRIYDGEDPTRAPLCTKVPTLTLAIRLARHP